MAKNVLKKCIDVFCIIQYFCIAVPSDPHSLPATKLQVKLQYCT